MLLSPEIFKPFLGIAGYPCLVAVGQPILKQPVAELLPLVKGNISGLGEALFLSKAPQQGRFASAVDSLIAVGEVVFALYENVRLTFLVNLLFHRQVQELFNGNPVEV